MIIIETNQKLNFTMPFMDNELLNKPFRLIISKIDNDDTNISVYSNLSNSMNIAIDTDINDLTEK